ncbi:LysR family transcriptional regulator [Novosphingobium rosa]|uniref:LysR family transcriptional regulator n=1 Tax=Novosphingobium rosa TaxID=76978 RepID=UPI00082A512A|nr:LysR family transcriptional regulator [Novosphingobium rosa]
MLKLDPLHAFVEVVRAGGFAAAARRMSVPRSTISLQIQTLEASLGTRLLKRSTRSVTLTDDGRQLYDRASSAIETLTEAVGSITSRPGVLKGLIRMTAPADFPTDPLAEAVAAFSQAHPEVRFEVTLSNATLDLVADNIDIAIRIGSSGMDTVERRLTDIDWCFCAASAWIDRHGEPKHLDDVAAFIAPPPRLRGYLERAVLGGAALPPAAMVIDSHIMAVDLVRRGAGVGLVPAGLIQGLLASGEVRPVLKATICARTRLVMAFPTRADMVPRVRAFADRLAEGFERPTTP